MRKKTKKRNVGWSKNGRPFSPSEFNNSYLKKTKTETSYSGYLTELGRQYKTRGKRVLK